METFSASAGKKEGRKGEREGEREGGCFRVMMNGTERETAEREREGGEGHCEPLNCKEVARYITPSLFSSPSVPHSHGSAK